MEAEGQGSRGTALWKQRTVPLLPKKEANLYITTRARETVLSLIKGQ
jgi:hypothetical protein